MQCFAGQKTPKYPTMVGLAKHHYTPENWQLELEIPTGKRKHIFKPTILKVPKLNFPLSQNSPGGMSSPRCAIKRSFPRAMTVVDLGEVIIGGLKRSYIGESFRTIKLLGPHSTGLKNHHGYGYYSYNCPKWWYQVGTQLDNLAMNYNWCG